jgi:hypothetical protein
MFIGPLPSNGCPNIDSICFGNVFTEPLPSNEHMSHNINLLHIFNDDNNNNNSIRDEQIHQLQ